MWSNDNFKFPLGWIKCYFILFCPVYVSNTKQTNKQTNKDIIWCCCFGVKNRRGSNGCCWHEQVTCSNHKDTQLFQSLLLQPSVTPRCQLRLLIDRGKGTWNRYLVLKDPCRLRYKYNVQTVSSDHCPHAVHRSGPRVVLTKRSHECQSTAQVIGFNQY